MPKYSIIIPVYNTSKYLEKCLNSILNQTVSDFECLLVDDCSTDDSANICLELCEKDKRFNLIKQPKNMGQSLARNKGIEISKGEYILFVDSDDYLETNLLEKLDAINANNEYDLITWGMYSDINKKNGDVTILISSLNYSKDIFENKITASNLYELWMHTFFASPCNKLYRTDIIKDKNIKFLATLVEFEDLVFNIDYCKYISNFSILKAPFYHYNQIEGQSSVYKRRWERTAPFEVSHIVFDRIIDFIAKYKKESKIVDDFILYAYTAFGNEIEYSFRIDNPKEYRNKLALLSNDKRYRKMLSYIHDVKLKKFVLLARFFSALKLKRAFVWFISFVNKKRFLTT